MHRSTSPGLAPAVLCGAMIVACVATLVAATPSGPSGHRVGSLGDLAFGGRVIPADGGSLEGVHVAVADSRGSYDAVMDSSGMFVGSFPALSAGRVTLRVYSDAGATRYHTSAVRLGPGATSQPMGIVLVPTRWRIRGGTFDGREVEIDPVRATTQYSEGSGYWRVTRRGAFIGRALSWAADSLPVRVAFRHERGDPWISASDSTRFWQLASNLESTLGRRLFRPASYAEIDDGADGILVAVVPRMSAAGKTFITFDQTGRIYEALVTVGQREYLGDPRVTTHELMHAIGFGHTRSWRSVMGPSTDGMAGVTAEDVAYAQLYFEIARIQRERDAQFGILESER